MQNKTPANWEEKTINDICLIERGSSPRPIKDFITDDKNGINWIKIGDCSGKYVTKTLQKITTEGAKKSRYVKKGDFIISNSMSYGKPYILAIDGCIHDGWFVLHLNNSLVNKDFLYYLLSSDFANQQYKALAAGAIVQNISSDLIKKVKFKLPPLQEQERIVKILDEAFENVEKAKQNAEQNLKNAKELFENIAEAIFTDIPAEKVKLSLLASLITKGSSPKWQGFDYCTKTDESILFITSENVGKDLLLLEKLKYLPIKFNDIQSRSILQKGDILTNIVGASIGRTAIFNLEETCNINQAVCLIRLKNPKYIPFIAKFLNTKMAISSMLGMVKDCARANVSLTNISDLYIPLPELTKQQEIVNKLDKLQEQTKQLEKIYEQKIKDLDELKQSILQKAFRGEL